MKDIKGKFAISDNPDSYQEFFSIAKKYGIRLDKEGTITSNAHEVINHVVGTWTVSKKGKVTYAFNITEAMREYANEE